MPGKMEISMADIARLANVSKPTVSRVFNDSPLVNQDTKAHVLEIAKKYGYAVNRHAQKLRSDRLNSIAVMLDCSGQREQHQTDPLLCNLLLGVVDTLSDEHQELLLCSSKKSGVNTLQDIISSRAADGFIFLGRDFSPVEIETVAKVGIPVAVWGAKTANLDVCTVSGADFRGGYLAGHYLIETQKRRRILFIDEIGVKEFYLRQTGLRKAIDECGDKVVLETLKFNGVVSEDLFTAASAFLESTPTQPDGVFAYNDIVAMAFIRALKVKGVQVPEDVSVVGYNDIPAAMHFDPALTTIYINSYQAGEMLVKGLMNTLAGLPHGAQDVQPQLIVRET